MSMIANQEKVQEDEKIVSSRLTKNQPQRQSGQLPLIVRSQLHNVNEQSPNNSQGRNNLYSKQTDQVIDLSEQNEIQQEEHVNQRNEEVTDIQQSDCITKNLQSQIPLIEKVSTPSQQRKPAYFSNPLILEMKHLNTSQQTDSNQMVCNIPQQPSRITRQEIPYKIQNTRIENESVIDSFNNKTGQLAPPINSKILIQNGEVEGKYSQSTEVIINNNLHSLQIQNGFPFEENKENIDNQNGQIYQQRTIEDNVYYYENQRNRINNNKFQNIFQPRQQIDGILLQNELNYFDDDNHHHDREEKKESVDYVNFKVESRQQKTLGSEQETQLYNPVILPNSIKSVRRKSQNTNLSRNNSLNSKPQVVEKDNRIKSSNSLKIKIKKQPSNLPVLGNMIKVESSQKLDIEYINDSSLDEKDIALHQNSGFNQLQSSQITKQKMKNNNNNNIFATNLIEQQRNEYNPQPTLKNKIQKSNVPSLLPPIHPIKQQKEDNNQQKYNLYYEPQPIQQEETQQLIRKSRSNSFTEDKNYMGTNFSRNSRIPSNQIKVSALSQQQKIVSNNNHQSSRDNQTELTQNQSSQRNNSNKRQNQQPFTFQLLKSYTNSQEQNQTQTQQAQHQQSQSAQRQQIIPLIIQQSNTDLISGERENVRGSQGNPQRVQQTKDNQNDTRNSQAQQLQQRQNSRQRSQQQIQQSSNQTSHASNELTQSRYNDINQTRDQINAQQQNLNVQFQSRSNRISQNPPPRFMIDNMYDQFLEFQNQLRSHQGLKLDKFISTTVFNKQQSQNLAQDAKQCSICLCEFEDEEKISFLACFHRFHTECIHKWFEAKSTCPLCKKDQKSLMKDVNSLLDDF